MTGNRLQRFAENCRGRDYVVGDLHGEFPRLQQALKKAAFDERRDRLFCTGDLVDRGPCSGDALEWLARPWFHSVRGNHEDMLIQARGEPAELTWWLECNGGGWWLEVDEVKRKQFIAAFEKLPLALEIATPQGAVGMVHADVPPWLDWPALVAALEEGDPDVQRFVLWERRRLSFLDRQPVAGVVKVYCGHTPLAAPRMLGNVHFIDTGICYGGKVTLLPLLEP